MAKTGKNILSIPDIILCAIPAFTFTAATDYIESGSFTPSAGYILASCVLFAALLCITYLLRKSLLKVKTEPGSERGIFRFFTRIMQNRFHILIIAIVIFLCWVPALLLLYPGTLINDTWGELIQFIKFNRGESGLSDHNPLFDTFLMGAFIVPIAQKTGEWHFVIFVYVVVQAFLSALAFSCTVSYALKKLNSGSKAALFMTIVYCLLPIYPASVQTVSKDALYAWIYVFFTIQYLEIVRSEGTVLRKSAFVILFTLSAILCCLTRKIGFYVVLASLLILFPFCRKNRLLLLIPALFSVVIMNVVMPAVITRLDAIPGGIQERYSLLFQMTARCFRDYPEDISEEEYAVVDKVLYPDEMAEAYDPTFADPVKKHTQKGAKEDYDEYIKVWFQMGKRHPDAYIAAANSMLAGWFSWTKYAPLMNMDHRNQLDSQYLPKWVGLRFISEETARSYEMMFEKLYENPFTRLFFTYGFYATLVPFFFAGTVLRKWKTRRPYWLAIVPLFLSLALGCWLAPASVFLEGKRYLYPITYTIPLLCMWCLFIYRENNARNEETAVSV